MNIFKAIFGALTEPTIEKMDTADWSETIARLAAEAGGKFTAATSEVFRFRGVKGDGYDHYVVNASVTLANDILDAREIMQELARRIESDKDCEVRISPSRPMTWKRPAKGEGREVKFTVVPSIHRSEYDNIYG